MNLLFTLTAYPPFVGGAQLLMHQLARELIRRHNLQVLTQWDERRTDWLLGTTLHAPREARTYQVDGVAVQRITLPAEARRRLRPWVWAYYAAQGPALARIAQTLESVMQPWVSDDVEVIHNCRIGREGLSYASLRLARARGVPFVFTPVHHPRWGGWWHRHYHQLYRQADAVIALTETERQTLIRLGVNERRVFVTGMGPVLADTWDAARFRAAHALGDDPVVLFLGQKYAYKGFTALLKAAPLVWRRFPETRFVFIGPRTSASRRAFANIPDHRILELDSVSLQDKTDALAACDVFCLPSSQESFGGVFTEAWSLGKPVIGADIPTMRDVIDDGGDGFRAVPRPGPLAERISELLAHPNLRAQMGQCGQAKVQSRYTWPRLAEQTEHIYQQMLGPVR